MELKLYQQEAVNILKDSYQMILADEMGLGKTATALKSFEDMLKEGRRLLVVCPASLKLNWCREIKLWLGYDVEPDKLMKGYVSVTNYERLKEAAKWSKLGVFSAVIFDEAHYLKNPESKRHYWAKVCAGYMQKRFLLTGTPMVSGPCDIAALLDVLGLLPLLGGYQKFYKRFCDPVWTGYGWDYSGSSNQEELHNFLKKYMIRRTKKECGIKLPRKTIVDVPMVECQQPYAETFKAIEMQQRRVNNLKFPYAVSFLDKLVLEGKRPVVFVHHRELMDKLIKKYKDKAVNIYGGQNMYQREEAVRRFQNEEIPLIICSLQASATGITLTSSDTAVFLEYLWSPAVSKQAQDRIHRLSQTKPVTIYNLYCPGSIELQKELRSYAKELDMKGIL